MKQLKALIIYMFYLAVFNSCFNSDRFEQSYPVILSEKIIESSCDEMNMLTDVLAYNSFKSAMVCWGWDLDYPEFYASVLRVDPDSWNHVVAPLNNFFFNNRKRRDKYLEMFHKLDRIGAISILSNLFSASIDINPNDLFYRLLTQIGERPFYKVLDAFHLSQNSIAKMEKIYLATRFVLQKDEHEKLAQAYKALAQKEEFRKRRVSIIDQFFQLLSRTGLNDFDKKYVDLFLSFRGDQGYWLHEWMNHINGNPHSLRQLLTYGRSTHPSARVDFSNLLASMPMTCTAREGSSEYLVRTDRVFRGFIEKLAHGDLIEFIDFINQRVVDIHLASTICDIVTTFGTRGIDLAGLLRNVFGVMTDSVLFPFFQRIHQNILKTEDISGEKNPYYLINLYLSDLFQEIIDFNHYVIVGQDSILPEELVSILASYPNENYEHFFSLIQRMTEPESLAILGAIGDFWEVLTLEDKEHLVSLTDILLENGLTHTELLTFLGDFVADLKVFVPLLASHLAFDRDVKNKTFLAFYNISKELKGLDVHEDLKKIVSPYEIIKTVRTIAKAVFEQENSHQYHEESSSSTRFPLLTYPKKISSSIHLGTFQAKACFDYLSRIEMGLELLIFDLPIQCRNLKSDYFSVRMIQYLNYLTLDNIALGYAPIVTTQGLGNSEIMEEAVESLLALEGEKAPISVSKLLDIIREILLAMDEASGVRDLGIQSLEDGLKLVHFLLRDNNDQMESYFAVLLNEFARIADQEIAGYIQLISELLRYYSQYQYEPEKFKEEHPCRVIFPKTYRLDPCRDKEQIKENIKEILVLLGRRHFEIKAPLELFLEAFTPGKGVKMPVKENERRVYRNHVIDFQQYLLYAYDSVAHSSEVEFFNVPPKNPRSFKGEATYSEQTEIVIRDSSFYGNFFGLLYLNRTTLGDDYIEEAKKSTDLFQSLSWCLNRPWCNSKLSPFVDSIPFLKYDFSSLPEYAKYWSSNAVNTAPALMAVGDDYNHQGRLYQHDNFMKAFLSIFVQTSPREARFTDLTHDMSDKYFDIHNGKIILRLAEMSALSNLARFVYDRFGPEKSKFDQVVFGDEMERVNRNFLKGMQLELTQQSLMNILNKYAGHGRELDQIIDSLVEWIAFLPYNKQRIVEEVLRDIVVIMSSIGPDGGDGDFKTFGNTYAGQSPFNQIDSLENILLIINELIRGSRHEDFEIFQFFNASQGPIRFIRDGLSTRALSFDSGFRFVGERRKLFYTFVNESFRIFETLFVKRSNINLVDMILIKTEWSRSEAWRILKNGIGSLGLLSRAVGSRERVAQFAELLAFLSSSGYGKTHNIRNWMASTFAPSLNGRENPEYKKLHNIIGYLLLPSNESAGQTKLRSALYQIFVADYQFLKPYLADILKLLDIISPGAQSPLP